MIIFHECLELPVQTSLVEHNQVIQALAANRADHPLDVSTGLHRQLRLMQAVRTDVFELPIHFIRGPGKSSSW
jgi:hypothetical protein